MDVQVSGGRVPGPGGGQAARILAGMVGDPLAGRWDRLADGSVVNVAGEMSSLALEIVGLALFGADLTGDAGQLGRAMSVGQRVAVLTTFLPIRWGPASTRAVRAAARRLGGTTEGVDGLASRLIATRRAGGGPAGAPGDLLDVLLRAPG